MYVTEITARAVLKTTTQPASAAPRLTSAMAANPAGTAIDTIGGYSPAIEF